MYWTKKHVLGCTAVHCNQKGAMDVVGRLRLEVLRKGLDDQVLVNNCGTIDLCDCGPNLVVYPDNIIYSGVTVKDIPDIVEHLKGGPPVERLILSRDTPAEQARKAFYVDALASAQPISPSRADDLAAAHDLGAGWIAEQLKRGFMARKPNAESGDDMIQVTKKARVRYGL